MYFSFLCIFKMALGLRSVGSAISYGSMMFYMSNPEVDVLRRVFPTALDTSPAPCDLPCSTSNCFWINRLSFKCPECSHKISQSSPHVLMSTEYCRSVTVSPRTPPASPISLLLRTKWSKFLISSETQISLSSMCERDKKILECWQHGCLELLETRICWCGMWHQSASLCATGNHFSFTSTRNQLFDSLTYEAFSTLYCLCLFSEKFLRCCVYLISTLETWKKQDQNGIVASLLPW